MTLYRTSFDYKAGNRPWDPPYGFLERGGNVSPNLSGPHFMPSVLRPLFKKALRMRVPFNVPPGVKPPSPNTPTLSSPLTNTAYVNSSGYWILKIPGGGQVASNSPFADVSTGIDAQSRPYVTVNGQTYWDLNSAVQALQYDGFYGMVVSGFPMNKSLNDLIAALRGQDNTIPFNVYQAPIATPPPTPTPAPEPSPIAPPAPPPPAASYTPPPGFQVLPQNWAPNSYAWPLYGNAPVHLNHRSGDVVVGTPYWSFGPAQQYYSLIPDPSGVMSASLAVGLDPQKLSLGLYSYRQSDLGPIALENNHTYELWQLDIFDDATNTPFNTFWYTVEGGGGGVLISDPLYLASRIVVDVSTMGTAEIARAGLEQAGVSEQNIKLATEAGAALATTIATVGATAALTAPVAASEPLLVTPEVAAMESAGATLLPPTLSTVALAPEAVGVSSAVVAGAASGVASTVSEVGAAADAVLPTSTVDATLVSPTVAAETTGAGAVGTAATAAGTTLVGAGKALATTALVDEFKKLTGQLPPVVAPYRPGTSAPAPTATAPAPSGGAGILIAALVGGLAIFSHKG